MLCQPTQSRLKGTSADLSHEARLAPQPAVRQADVFLPLYARARRARRSPRAPPGPAWAPLGLSALWEHTGDGEAPSRECARTPSGPERAGAAPMFAAPAAANPRASGRGSPAASKGRRKLPSRPSGAVSGTGGRDSRAGRTRRAPRRGQGVAGAASGPCWRQSHARLPAHGRGSRGQQTDAARDRHQLTSAEPGAGRPPWPGHGRVFQEEQVGGRPTGPGGRGHEQGDGQCGQEGARGTRTPTWDKGRRPGAAASLPIWALATVRSAVTSRAAAHLSQ